MAIVEFVKHLVVIISIYIFYIATINKNQELLQIIFKQVKTIY